MVEDASGLSDWSSTRRQVRKAVREKEAVPVPPQDAWRVPYLWKLLEQRLQHYYSGDKEKEEGVQALVDSLCVM